MSQHPLPEHPLENSLQQRHPFVAFFLLSALVHTGLLAITFEPRSGQSHRPVAVSVRKAAPSTLQTNHANPAPRRPIEDATTAKSSKQQAMPRLKKREPAELLAKIGEQATVPHEPPSTADPVKLPVRSPETLPDSTPRAVDDAKEAPVAGTDVVIGDAPPNNSGEPIKAEFGTKDGPRVLGIIKPDYPLTALRRRREGHVLMQLEISRTGKLTSANILEPAGYGFDEAALEAVSEVHFSPALRNGEPVACIALLPVHFQLESHL
jgi:TonB family protein